MYGMRDEMYFDETCFKERSRLCDIQQWTSFKIVRMR